MWTSEWRVAFGQPLLACRRPDLLKELVGVNLSERDAPAQDQEVVHRFDHRRWSGEIEFGCFDRKGVALHLGVDEPPRAGPVAPARLGRKDGRVGERSPL